MNAQTEVNSIPDIEAMIKPTHDESSRQSMVSMIRKFAINDLREAVRNDYERKVAPKLAGEGEEIRDWRAIDRAMSSRLSHRFYSTVRYHAQEMTYLSVQPSIERALPEMIEVAKTAARSNSAGGSLRLNPDIKLPNYLTALDVHLAPGAFHSEHTADDVAQGAVVSYGSLVFQAHNPYRRRSGSVGRSVAYWIKGTRPNFKPRRILDIGTTSGKNFFPYHDAFPNAELHAIDLGAPVLRYGHALATHAGVPVHFSQQNAEHTDFPDSHFDLIVSSFFLHEIPLKATRNVLAECHRLLAGDGIMAHMELPDASFVSAYENFYWNWDTENNNEPFYTKFREQNPLALSAEAGFNPANCFKTMVPELDSFGKERYARYFRGEIAAPGHAQGAWFVFGARR